MTEPGIDRFSLVARMLSRSLLQQIFSHWIFYAEFFYTEFFYTEFIYTEFISSLWGGGGSVSNKNAC